MAEHCTELTKNIRSINFFRTHLDAHVYLSIARIQTHIVLCAKTQTNTHTVYNSIYTLLLDYNFDDLYLNPYISVGLFLSSRTLDSFACHLHVSGSLSLSISLMLKPLSLFCTFLHDRFAVLNEQQAKTRFVHMPKQWTNEHIESQQR